jgi:hypothetical protein
MAYGFEEDRVGKQRLIRLREVRLRVGLGASTVIAISPRANFRGPCRLVAEGSLG